VYKLLGQILIKFASDMDTGFKICRIHKSTNTAPTEGVQQLTLTVGKLFTKTLMTYCSIKHTQRSLMCFEDLDLHACMHGHLDQHITMNCFIGHANNKL